jgi:predicted ATPase
MAQVMWMLGYADSAFKLTQEALSLAQELPHPHILAYAFSFAGLIYHHHRERQLTQQCGEALITISTEQGFPQNLAAGTLLRNSVLDEQAHGAQAIAQMRQGLAAWRATRAELWQPFWLALLAETYGKAGQAEEGLGAVAEALAVVDKTGECWWEAELLRVKGELLLQSCIQRLEPEMRLEAVESFHNAISIARRQSAKSLELRATTSLARILRNTNRCDEGRTMLAGIYNWFTEGFDTADLKEAKALLDELATE